MYDTCDGCDRASSIPYMQEPVPCMLWEYDICPSISAKRVAVASVLASFVISLSAHLTAALNSSVSL